MLSHAGFRPGLPGPDPSEHVRLWIREPFLSRDYNFGKHVVHGHTPLRTAQPDQRPFRTNLDTGAVLGGALTAGVFTNDQAHAVEFLQVCEAKPSVARHPVRDAAAAVVSGHGKALEPERAHDRGLTGGNGTRAAARFHPWRAGCEHPHSQCRGSCSLEDCSQTTSPSPPLASHGHFGVKFMITASWVSPLVAVRDPRSKPVA